jgi:hypothetical protein
MRNFNNDGREGYDYGPGPYRNPHEDFRVDLRDLPPPPPSPPQGSRPVVGGGRNLRGLSAKFAQLQTFPPPRSNVDFIPNNRFDSVEEFETPPLRVSEGSVPRPPRPPPVQSSGAPCTPSPLGPALAPPPPIFTPYLNQSIPSNNAPPPLAYHGPPPLGFGQNIRSPFMPYSDAAQYHMGWYGPLPPVGFPSPPVDLRQPYMMWQDPRTHPPFDSVPRAKFESRSDITGRGSHELDSSRRPNPEHHSFSPPRPLPPPPNRPGRSSSEGWLYPQPPLYQGSVHNDVRPPIRASVAGRDRFSGPEVEQLPSLYETLLREPQREMSDFQISRDGQNRKRATAPKFRTNSGNEKGRESARTLGSPPVVKRPIFVEPLKDMRRSDMADKWTEDTAFVHRPRSVPQFNVTGPHNDTPLRRKSLEGKSDQYSGASCEADYCPTLQNGAGTFFSAPMIKEELDDKLFEQEESLTLSEDDLAPATSEVGYLRPPGRLQHRKKKRQEKRREQRVEPPLRQADRVLGAAGGDIISAVPPKQTSWSRGKGKSGGDGFEKDAFLEVIEEALQSACEAKDQRLKFLQEQAASSTRPTSRAPYSEYGHEHFKRYQREASKEVQGQHGRGTRATSVASTSPSTSFEDLGDSDSS